MVSAPHRFIPILKVIVSQDETEESVQGLCAEFGRVGRVKQLPSDPHAFYVSYETAEQAQQAFYGLRERPGVQTARP